MVVALALVFATRVSHLPALISAVDFVDRHFRVSPLARIFLDRQNCFVTNDVRDLIQCKVALFEARCGCVSTPRVLEFLLSGHRFLSKTVGQALQKSFSIQRVGSSLQVVADYAFKLKS